MIKKIIQNLSPTKKALIFDSSTIISLSMNGLLLEELKRLKESFKGKFIITDDVKKEVIDNPLKIKRFELEALKVKQLLEEKIFELPESLGVDSNIVLMKAKEIMEIANSMFESQHGEVKLIQIGEASALALSKLLTEKGISNVMSIDERTMRMLVEKPENLKELLQKKLHTRINLKKENFEYFKGFKIIRSTELIYVAYKKGLTRIRDGNLVLDALLYALKFKGCSISDEEIDSIKKLS